MGTLSGEAIILFSFLPNVTIWVNYLRKEFAPLGAILFFKSRPYFERATLSRKANKKSQELFPFVKMIENHESELIHLTEANLDVSQSLMYLPFSHGSCVLSAKIVLLN